MSKTQKIIVPILGMHCRSCEILIESELSEINEIEKAEANYKKSQVEIFYLDKAPSDIEISEAIGRAGYSIGNETPKGFFSANKSDYKELGIAILFLVGGYYILKGLGITNINIIPSSGELTVPLVLLIGLIAGISTCMALVGGLVLGISAKHNEAHPEVTPFQKFRPHLYFNAGRIASYAFFGGILGLVGSAVQLSSFALGLLTIAVGIIMLGMGLQLIEIFPWANRFKLTLPKSISDKLGIKNHQKEYSHKNAALLGALTFFLPCGFTQAMQVFAIGTGSFFWGAIVMGLFAIGTLPGLLGIGGLTSIVKGAFARKFFKFAGLAVIAFAFFNISNGLGLTGWKFAYGQSTEANLNDPNVTIENGIQTVRMTESGRGYSPNKFTIKKGIPVKWIIGAQAPFSCASTILMPEYNIRKSLSAGENIIDFTPDRTGKINFSCSMGMYKGYFNIIQ